MKKLSIPNKIIFIFNAILAFALLLSFLSYYISPNSLSFISLVSLSVPFLIIGNILFCIYWVLKFKKQFWLSAVVLFLGFQFVSSFYTIGEKKVLLTTDTKIMSYNVRMFNLYEQLKTESLKDSIEDFIKSKNPDVICIQEYSPSSKIQFKYPFKYIKMSDENKDFGHAIFSKHKILNAGSIGFENSSNNAVFVDVLKNNDTLRIYNVHLESLRVNPNDETMNKETTEKVKIKLEAAFKKQTSQVKKILSHQDKISHKSLICGDFNNNAFSWVYRALKTDKNDAFNVAGKGFGSTFDYAFPLRIDFILVDKAIEINNFKTFPIQFSDHYPIMARINY